jgi:hypothetical protein
MKKLILAVVLLVNSSNLTKGEVFKFKDGTIVKGKILYLKERDTFNINAKGLHIISEKGGLYVHHYPYSRGASEEYVPRPPIGSALNPAGLPNCVPTRINFIQFSKPTIRNILWGYQEELKYHANKYSSDDLFDMGRAVAALHKAYYWKPRNKFELRSPIDTRAWNNEINTKFKAHHGFFVYGKYLKGRTNVHSRSP